jgi:hypothetical protein
MKGNMLGVAPGFMQDVQHALSARVIERVDDDERIAMAIRMSGEPGCDGISSALGQPFDSLPYIARYIQNMCGELLPKPGAAHLVIFDKKNTPQGNSIHSAIFKACP